MKRIILLVSSVLISVNILFSQSVTVGLVDVGANPGDTIYVPLNIKGFANTGAYGFKLKYDNTVIKYLDVINLNPNFVSMIGNYDVKKDILAYAWASEETIGTTVPDGKLMELKFKYFGGTTYITFDTIYSVVSDYDGIKFKPKYISAKIDDINVNVKKVSNLQSIEVYPNPAENLVNIKSNNFNPKEVIIYNLAGQQLISKILNNTKTNTITTINISNLDKGIYLIKVLHKNGYYFKKLAVK